MYKIPCGDCEKVYIRESGRGYGARESEHMTEVEATEEKKFTRSRKKEAETETHKSALADHASQTNHIIAWNKVSLPSKDVNGRPAVSGRL